MLAENEETETKHPDELIAQPDTAVPTEAQTAVQPEVETVQALKPEIKPTKRPKRVRRKGAPALNQVIAWFSACARCSYFLAGYRTIFSKEDVREAVDDSQAGWLVLKWDQAVCKLVVKTYGSRFDADCYHYDGICPECRRQFSFRGRDEAEGESSFRIEIKPRTGR